MVTAQTIKSRHSNVFTFLHGDANRAASNCRAPDQACSDSLVYVSDDAQLLEARRHRPAILVVRAKLAQALHATADADTSCFSVQNVPMGMAVLLRYFDRKRARFAQWGERHPTAVVHPQARIGDGALLGPCCVIGARASIGEDCMIGAHAVIENDAQIGARTIIHPHVFVGAACEIGMDCEIHPHTSIGADGFGYVSRADGRPLKITHLGNVKIGDEVEIGSNCAIDRATLTSTHIRSGTKLDNLCHIAHNCDLGENGYFTAGFMMGGSTKIGRQFVTGGNSVVTAHITLADNVVLAGRSTVTNDVTAGGCYGGYPLQPLKDALRTIATIGQLNEMRRGLNRVLRHLGLADVPRKPPAC
ncbi:MAG TPA: UDP-3-O-(3-hydroxymyristoyl)glucosamine N-acyltransferase [Steroidobacteraceae bacterium]|nr:UDP-3-O-(3-hydroxymyristoyl)glucosamine N-acyltransferase [Steroidobacteraceae bacterium]